MDFIKAEVLYGHVDIKQFNKFENGRMVAYGYSIRYDQHGNETSRTEPEAISSMGFDDGSPFTEDDYKRIMQNVHG